MRLGFLGIIAVAIPALELVGIYLVGQRIGLAWTFIWLFGAVVAGVMVMRSTGEGFMPRMAQAAARGEDPFSVLLASGRRFLAGVLLILPGLGSDLIALLLLLWPSPPGMAPGPQTQRPQANRPPPSDDVIEGEFRRED